jgi:DNA repair photolyase
MSLNKSKGNMYPWVSHTHSHLGGECSHKCAYCYVDNPRFGRPERYKGQLRIVEKELDVNYGSDKTIFIEHQNDLFAEDVPQEFINKVLNHCFNYPNNTYVFQTKNPARFLTMDALFPNRSILGTTIETNRDISKYSKAPAPIERFRAMLALKTRKFITIEPVMDFDVDILAEWIARINPEFLNLGADSKNHNLPEPTIEKIEALVKKLKEYGIELREKHNLKRLTATPQKERR